MAGVGHGEVRDYCVRESSKVPGEVVVSFDEDQCLGMLQEMPSVVHCSSMLLYLKKLVLNSGDEVCLVLPKLLSIHPVWRINLLLHCLESFSCTDLFLLMDLVTVAEARFPVYTWEYVLIQFLKGRLAYHLELVSLPQLPIATNNPVRDSMEDVMEVTDNEIHEEATHSHSIKFDYTEECIPLQHEVPQKRQPTEVCQKIISCVLQKEAITALDGVDMQVLSVANSEEVYEGLQALEISYEMVGYVFSFISDLGAQKCELPSDVVKVLLKEIAVKSILCSTKAQSRSFQTSLARVMAICHDECLEAFLLPLIKSPNLAMSHAAMLKQVVRQSLSDIDQEALLQQVIDGTSEASSMSEPQADVVLTLLEVIGPDRIPLKNLVEALHHSRKRLEASVKFAKLVVYVLESFSQKLEPCSDAMREIVTSNKSALCMKLFRLHRNTYEIK